MAFWAYLLASLVEYPVYKRKNKKYDSFWIPRFFSATVVPWTIFLVWYLAPATGGKFRLSYMELIWALVVSYFSGLAGGLIERTLEEQRLAFCFKVLVIFLALASAFLYIAFTYQLPWIDMFRGHNKHQLRFNPHTQPLRSKDHHYSKLLVGIYYWQQADLIAYTASYAHN